MFAASNSILFGHVTHHLTQDILKKNANAEVKRVREKEKVIGKQKVVESPHLAGPADHSLRKVTW